jgi:hypothetical protein
MVNFGFAGLDDVGVCSSQVQDTKMGAGRGGGSNTEGAGRVGEIDCVYRRKGAPVSSDNELLSVFFLLLDVLLRYVRKHWIFLVSWGTS